jgi:hypothetical protein
MSLDHNMRPFEVWSRIKPTLTHLKVFCYKVYALIPKENKQKLDFQFTKFIFLVHKEECTIYIG